MSKSIVIIVFAFVVSCSGPGCIEQVELKSNSNEHDQLKAWRAVGVLKDNDESFNLFTTAGEAQIVTPENAYHLSSITPLRRVNIACGEFPQNAPGDSVIVHLENLPNLESIFLVGTHVTDLGLKSISRIDNLKSLAISYHQKNITDQGLSCLRNLKKLEFLHLREEGGGISDDGVNFISELRSLRHLNLWCRGISTQSIIGISKLVNLTELGLFGNVKSGTTFDSLASLTQLKRFYFMLAGVKAIPAAVISAMVSLEFINVFEGTLSDEVISALHKATPAVSIVVNQRDETGQ